MNLEKLKENHKTKFLAQEYERLLKEEGKINEMIKEDKNLQDLAEEDLKNIKIQKENIEKQVEEI
ncbi:MAG: hypothetical protein U9R00_03695, partial [Patescibacteria group bacterium]|nr:hypothetical protein [Patescibacteria group bacterium]